MADLNIGTSLRTKNFRTLKVIEELGEGGQGKVYRVDCDGQAKALKWYFGKRIKDPKKFYENLENNIRKGAPTPAFLWPEDLTDIIDGTFGYVMPLRPDGYVDFSKFLVGRVAFSGVTAMCNAALNIVAGFRELHNKGYSYQDLNDGNFFIHPKSGDVLICDNDNVSEFGKSSGIAGKARYMAPEIVVKGVPPNTQTDRFSLSVILFLLWTNNHPLEGRAACPPCMDAKNERRIYGEKPLFIFDPQDVSNRPVPGLHKGVIARYPFLPKYLQDEFVKAFSHQAMHTPSRRIIEREWLHLFLRMRGEVYKCAGCGEVYFADPVHPSKCPKCQRTASLWGYLKTPRYNLGIHRKTRLYACHAHKDNDDHETQIGQVIAGAGGFALQNQTRKEWRVVSEGKTAVLKPSEAVALKKQMKIGLGDSDIEIV